MNALAICSLLQDAASEAALGALIHAHDKQLFALLETHTERPLRGVSTGLLAYAVWLDTCNMAAAYRVCKLGLHSGHVRAAAAAQLPADTVTVLHTDHRFCADVEGALFGPIALQASAPPPQQPPPPPPPPQAVTTTTTATTTPPPLVQQLPLLPNAPPVSRPRPRPLAFKSVARAQHRPPGRVAYKAGSRPAVPLKRNAATFQAEQETSVGSADAGSEYDATEDDDVSCSTSTVVEADDDVQLLPVPTAQAARPRTRLAVSLNHGYHLSSRTSVGDVLCQHHGCNAVLPTNQHNLRNFVVLKVFKHRHWQTFMCETHRASASASGASTYVCTSCRTSLNTDNWMLARSQLGDCVYLCYLCAHQPHVQKQLRRFNHKRKCYAAMTNE